VLTEWYEHKSGGKVYWVRSPVGHEEDVVLMIERRGLPEGASYSSRSLFGSRVSKGYEWHLSWFPPENEFHLCPSPRDGEQSMHGYWLSLEAAKAGGDRTWDDWWDWYSSTELYSGDLRQLSADELAALDEVGPLEVAERLANEWNEAEVERLYADYLRLQLAEHYPPVLCPMERVALRLTMLDALDEYRKSQRKEDSP